MTGKHPIFQADLLLGPCSLIDKCPFFQAVLLFGPVLLLQTREYGVKKYKMAAKIAFFANEAIFRVK